MIFQKIFSLHWVYFVERLSFCCLTDESGWWQGRLQGKEGLLPGNYVEKLWCSCADLSQLVSVPHVWETRIAASPLLLSPSHHDLLNVLSCSLISHQSIFHMWTSTWVMKSVINMFSLSLSLSLSLSVYQVVFMMFLFAIFIVVQTYPDLLNICSNEAWGNAEIS
jgi:hypothetical protein